MGCFCVCLLVNLCVLCVCLFLVLIVLWGGVLVLSFWCGGGIDGVVFFGGWWG